jgi:hypothetical protein
MEINKKINSVEDDQDQPALRKGKQERPQNRERIRENEKKGVQGESDIRAIFNLTLYVPFPCPFEFATIFS